MEVPGIYWHFVDVMWIVVFLTRLHHLSAVLNPLRSEGEAFRLFLYVVARSRRSSASSSCSPRAIFCRARAT